MKLDPNEPARKFWIVYRDFDYYHYGDYVIGPVYLEQDKFGRHYFINDAGRVYTEIRKRFDTKDEAEDWLNRPPLWWRVWRTLLDALNKGEKNGKT